MICAGGLDLNPVQVAMQPLPALPPQIAVQNEPWFNKKPPPLNIISPVLFPGDESNHLPEPDLQPVESYDSSYHQRVSSSRVPDNQSHVKLQPLANMLDRELNGTRRWDVGKLLEHLFSDEVLGLPVRNFTL